MFFRKFNEYFFSVYYENVKITKTRVNRMTLVLGEETSQREENCFIEIGGFSLTCSSYDSSVKSRAPHPDWVEEERWREKVGRLSYITKTEFYQGQNRAVALSELRQRFSLIFVRAPTASRSLETPTKR
ncbi:hypothetical protein DLM78_15685 [Leptospira stimsonii]|uniref:Uncharacterized protein n=1 Tax=Leptospira stimsonii TaxID=2202203 RepID=A0A8B3CQA5_9LEPT|nr:hypothetical protein DLM78_15685 [Leptospira stimsonii]